MIFIQYILFWFPCLHLLPDPSYLSAHSTICLLSLSLSLENRQINKGKKEKVWKTHTHTDTCPHRKPRTPQNHFCRHSEDLAVSHRYSGECSSYLPNQKPAAPPKPKARSVLYSRFYFLTVLQEAFLIPSSPRPIHLQRCSSHINVFS